MKKAYMIPCMQIEEFAANQAVSSCSVTEGFTYTFDCLDGPNADQVKNAIAVNLADNCTNNIGYLPGGNTGIWTNASGGRGSENNPTIGYYTHSGRTNKVTYTASNLDGILYCVSNSKTSYATGTWDTTSVEKTVQCTNKGRYTHVGVAPVLDAANVKSSW